MDPEAPIAVRVHYDLASSVCYVAHRVMERMQGALDEIGVALDWTPIDLASLLGWRRDGPIEATRRENALRIAGELGVPLRVPTHWLDARRAMAIALAFEGTPREPAWRERTWSGVFEAGDDPADPHTLASWQRELGVALPEERVAAGLRTLEERTRRAAEDQVTGAPTFMLGSWPFGGIQQEDTMRDVLGRFADRARSGRLTGVAS